MKSTVFSDLSPADLKKLKKMAQPSFVPVMLATLTDKYFDDPDWIFEHKFDGERCLAIKKSGKVTLKSRSERTINEEYPELVTALEAQKADNFIIDGEIIGFKNGTSSFEVLQSRINLKNLQTIQEREKQIAIQYAIFDVVYAEGSDTRDLPLLARKSVLEKLLIYKDVLLLSAYLREFGLEAFKKACNLKWEGLIAKKISSTYIGVRSPAWLKFKCVAEQELVIAGYTDPQRSRIGFGALLVGYYQKGKLIFAGKVGTGFSDEALQLLSKKMQKLETKECPFYRYDGPTQGVHWVKPELVAEFKFAQWTDAGKLRVPRYKGLRDDKRAKEVVRETPK